MVFFAAIGLGALVGGLLPRGHGGVALAWGLFGLGFALLARTQPGGDVLLASLCAAGGTVLGALPPARIAGPVFGAAMFALVAEGTARVALEPPPHLGIPFDGRHPACHVWSRPIVDDPRPTVVWLGDSLFAFDPVDDPTLDEPPRAVDHAAALDPSRRHLDASVVSSGPDIHLALAHHITDNVDVDALVVGLFPENDITDLDRPLSCCGDGPALTGEATPNPACSGADRTQPWLHAPRWWRATEGSHLVGHLRARWYADPRPTVSTLPRRAGAVDARGRRLREVLAGFHQFAEARQLTLLFVLFPWGPDLTPDQPPTETHRWESRMQAAVESLDRPLVRVRPLLIAAGARVDDPAWFRADRAHLGPRGHRLVGEAVADALHILRQTDSDARSRPGTIHPAARSPGVEP